VLPLPQTTTVICVVTWCRKPFYLGLLPCPSIEWWSCHCLEDKRCQINYVFIVVVIINGTVVDTPTIFLYFDRLLAKVAESLEKARVSLQYCKFLHFQILHAYRTKI